MANYIEAGEQNPPSRFTKTSNSQQVTGTLSSCKSTPCWFSQRASLHSTGCRSEWHRLAFTTPPSKQDGTGTATTTAIKHRSPDGGCNRLVMSPVTHRPRSIRVVHSPSHLQPISPVDTQHRGSHTHSASYSPIHTAHLLLLLHSSTYLPSLSNEKDSTGSTAMNWRTSRTRKMALVISGWEVEGGSERACVVWEEGERWIVKSCNFGVRAEVGARRKESRRRRRR